MTGFVLSMTCVLCAALGLILMFSGSVLFVYCLIPAAAAGLLAGMYYIVKRAVKDAVKELSNGDKKAV